jgi:hypothetical protein
VNKTVTKFSSFAEPEKADRESYEKLSGNEGLQVLVNHSGFQPLSYFHFFLRPVAQARRGKPVQWRTKIEAGSSALNGYASRAAIILCLFGSVLI